MNTEVLAKFHYPIVLGVFLFLLVPSLMFDSQALSTIRWVLYLGNALFISFVLHFCMPQLLAKSTTAEDSSEA